MPAQDTDDAAAAAAPPAEKMVIIAGSGDLDKAWPVLLLATTGAAVGLYTLLHLAAFATLGLLATFVVPAMYINQVDVSWWQIFLACFIGGSLGVVLIIPLRKYFVNELHG